MSNKYNKNSKVNVLIYGDSPTCGTGFATVVRNVAETLYKTGKYNIVIFGINYWGDPHNFPYQIYPAGINAQHDPYGKQKFVQFVQRMNFDILYFVQDSFILDFVPVIIPKLKADGKKFKSIVYYPVDGTLKPEWVNNILPLDYKVTYTKFGIEETLKHRPELTSLVDIPHGVNTKEFKPLNKELINTFRKHYFGPHADKFIVCFPEGHLVYTDSGLVDISRIDIGEKVLTHKNRFNKVLNTFERDYDGDLITISDGKGGVSISATPEHPVFAVKRDEILCKYSTHFNGRKNYVCRPKTDNVVYTKPCYHCSYYEDRVITLDDIKETPINDLNVGDFLVHPIDMTVDEDIMIPTSVMSEHGASKYIPNFIKPTESIMEMFGLWLSDGSYIKKDNKVVGITFTQRSDRRDVIDKFKQGIYNCFGLECAEYSKVRTSSIKNYNYVTEMTQVNCYSTNAALTFLNLFGEYSYGKHIPQMFNTLPLNLQLSLCLGYIKGDGCVGTNKKHSNSTRITVVGQSQELMSSVQFMLLRNKIISSVFTDNGYKKPLYRLIIQGNSVYSLNELLGFKSISDCQKVKDVRNRFFIDNFLFTEIKFKSSSYFSGKVYNIEVENDNSYVVNGVAVHNCNVNRNQTRKDIYRTIAAFKIFRESVPDSILYLHMAKIDQGGNLEDIAKSYGFSITDDVILPEKFSSNTGYPVETLNLIYNSVDLLVSSTSGEGWGLCMSPDTILYTDLGIKTLKEIKLDDKVLSENGTFNNVTAIMSNEGKDTMYHILTAFGTEPICCSEDHGFYVGSTTGTACWKSAKDLIEGDLLVYPSQITYPTNTSKIMVPEILHTLISSKKKKVYTFPEEIELTSSLVSLLGLFLDYVRRPLFYRTYSSISFFPEEEEYKNSIIALVSSLFGDQVVITENVSELSTRVKFKSIVFTTFLREVLGVESESLHSLLMSMSLDNKLAFLKAIFSASSNNEELPVSCRCRNKKEAFLLRSWLLELGILATIHRRKKCYRVHIVIEYTNKFFETLKTGTIIPFTNIQNSLGIIATPEVILVPVMNVLQKREKTRLLDIQVANTENFVAEHAVVHNSWIESMRVKTPVLMPNNTAMKEYITEDKGYLISSGNDPSLFAVKPNDSGIIRPLVDVEDMAEQMVYIHNNYAEALAKAEVAYNWVSNNMDWQRDIGRMWLSVFKQAVSDLRNTEESVVDTDDEAIKVIDSEVI